MDTKCRRCGRGLSDPKSREIGMGPVCAAKQVIAEALHEECPILIDVGSLQDEGLIWRRREDGVLATNVRQAFVWHSPTGFEVGYGGSGPADLAMNVLAQLIPLGSDGAEGWLLPDGQRISASAGLLHQDFKWQFLASNDRNEGIVPIELIQDWISEKRTDDDFKKRLASYIPAPKGWDVAETSTT